MAGKQYFEEGGSIYKPPLFFGLNYKYWEAKMKIFVEYIDQGIWDLIENGPYIPKFKNNGSFIEKPWSQWTNDECKMAKLGGKVKKPNKKEKKEKQEKPQSLLHGQKGR